MEEQTLLCKQCRNVFKIPEYISRSINNKTSCPKCGSSDLDEAPIWAPLGSGSNIFESSEWEYECQKCKNRFAMPIPKSPSEDKARRCPQCGSEHLHRLTSTGGQPLYCG
jgi:putative FmdB family regulatory protein